MATSAQISPEEYLSTAFDGLDREYVRGEVVERTVPTFTHANAQGAFCYLFHPLRSTHKLYAAPEVRLRLRPDLFRIPDLSVFEGIPEDVPANPPLAVIEILSSDDRCTAVLAKLDEFAAWGVPNIWIVDLARRKFMIYRDANLVTVEVFALPGYPVEIHFSDLTA